ncbi:hypothetical protein [Micromonospora sp. NPDC023956]|uniref:hypothetical protein n=1 Tax=Micromonospora sp. NPDC023956 TaxID=3155722 RepID=UPI0033CCE293
MRRAAIASPSAPTPGRTALSGSAGWIRLARAAVLVVTGVGAVLLAVAIAASPAQADTAVAGGHPGPSDAAVGQSAPGDPLVMPLRERAVASTEAPLSTVRPAPSHRSPSSVVPTRPALTSAATRATPPFRPADRDAGARPRPAPLVPGIVEQIVPSRPAPPAPAPPAVPAVVPPAVPVRPPASPPPGTPDEAAPPPGAATPRPSRPTAPPRPVPDDGPAGPVEAPAVPPAPDAVPPPGRTPLPPRLVGAVDGVRDGVVRPIVGLLTDVVGGVLAPILDLPGGGHCPLLPPGSSPPAAPVMTPLPESPTDQPPVTDQPSAVDPPVANPQVQPPMVHNGGTSAPGVARGGGPGRPGDPAVPGRRSVPAAPVLDSGSASGDSSEVPLAPGDDRVGTDSGSRTGVALPPTTSGPDRSERDVLAELPPAPARGRSPTVAARPG